MSFSSLRQLQADLAQAIRAPHEPSAPAEADARALPWLKGVGTLTPARQLSIYREQFWLRHIESLRDDFPTLSALLGDPGFLGMAQGYLNTHPPSCIDLGDLGNALPGYLRGEAPYCNDPLLAECADVEWAFLHAFDAPDADPVTPATLKAFGGVDGDRLLLKFHPSLHLLALRFPSHDFRNAVRRGQSPPRPSEQGLWLAVWRQGCELFTQPVPKEAFVLLQELKQGQSLGQACERAATSAPDPEAPSWGEVVQGWFAQWMRHGWVVGLEERRPPPTALVS